MRISLASIEIGLQRLVEGAASWMIPGSARQSNMTNQLIEAMHANIKSFPDGSLVAPGLFIICVSPADRPGPREWQTLSENLLNTIRETAQISGYIFLHPPALNLEVDPEFPSGVFSTRAINTQIDLTPTSGLDILTPIDPVSLPVNAFLIVNVCTPVQAKRRAPGISLPPEPKRSGLEPGDR